MRRKPRGREQSVFQNPVLVGALTVLVTIVAVYLAYQANNGLPFVPTYALRVQILNAGELTKGAEVHEGGSLVGLIDTIEATRTSTGAPIALLNLKLNKSIQPLPVDSTFTVRLKAAIGLKYLAIAPGTSRVTWADGATVPVTQTSATTDLDQVLGMFDPPTRAGVAATTVGFSNALAGRGGDINDAIGAFLPLVTTLEPVARNLASPKANLGGFFRGLGAFSAAVAPVAQAQANLYTNLDTTFRALAGVAVPYLQDWISQTPPTFSTVIADSPKLQSFVTDTAALFADLRPGFATLPASAPVTADAFAAGAKNLPGTIELDKLTVELSKALAAYGANPTVQQGLNRVTQFATSLQSPLAFLTPVQAPCNYVTLFLRNIASTLSDPVASGTTLRFVIVAIDDVLGGEAVPSQRVFTAPTTDLTAQHGPLHANPYPNTASPGQPAECAAGNEPYSPSQAVIGNPPGSLGLSTEQTTRPGG
jgi:ABC-type transporter Mla subunit MlaD